MGVNNRVACVNQHPQRCLRHITTTRTTRRYYVLVIHTQRRRHGVNVLKSLVGWTCSLDMFTPLLPEDVPGTDADPASFFRGEGVRGVCQVWNLTRFPTLLPKWPSWNLPTLQYEKAFYFMELDSLTRPPEARCGLCLQTPFRGSSCCPPYILDLATPLFRQKVYATRTC